MQDAFILKEKRQKVKEEKRKYDQAYRAKNKLKLSEQWKNYDQQNKIEVRARKRKYIKNRRANDPLFRLRNNISKYIHIKLSKKSDSCMQYLCYSMNDLKNHIEKQFETWMTWDNQGRYNSKTWNDNDQSTWKWQLDHIIPQSDLPYTSMEDNNFQKCWELDNLRPLSAKQNLIDGVTRVRHNYGRKND